MKKFFFSDGEFEVLKETNVLGKMAAGRAFGELAILYNCTRTASVRGKLKIIMQFRFLYKRKLWLFYSSALSEIVFQMHK